ncbi:cadherin-like beta sandwich domain-containing protein [Trueperella sp.]|uniref:cadherin-like beta sandwich domain-containing protein n=1 Tax=Trueperella sp. TaxID=2699835 RepID=UPI002621C1DE|nr:cadherin-like beta sandwich domain-containing protein [Trueperella sp.]
MRLRMILASVVTASMATAGVIAVPSSVAFAAEDAATTPVVVDQVGERTGLLQDLAIDQIPFGDKGSPVWFSPSQHTYTATAYKHMTSVSVRAFPAAGATVTINGQAGDSNDRRTIDLAPGANTITVQVSGQGGAETYTITVNKVDTDYSGNVQIPATVVGNRASEADNAAMTDGDTDTSWTTTTIDRDNAWSESRTGFTVNLGSERYVRRLMVWGQTQFSGNKPWWHPGSSVTIAVRATGSDEWTEVVTQGGMRNDGGDVWWWDLGDYYKAESIRVWLNPRTNAEMPASTALSGVTINEVEVWGLPDGKKAPVIDENLPTEGFDPGDGMWGVNRAQTLALHNGVILPAWVPSENYGRGIMDGFEQQQSGGVLPMFYDPPLFNAQAMKSMGQTPWAIAKAPGGNNSMAGAGDPHDFLTELQAPYRNSLVDIQFGDEAPYSEHETDLFKAWFDFSKVQYPGAMVHSNQYHEGGWINNIGHYVQKAQPDLISWDTYYFGSGSGIFGGAHRPANDAVKVVLGSGMMQSYRKAALEGLTGDESSPVLFGQYLDYSFDNNMSDSEKAITPMVSLAAGQKWFGLFRMEKNGYDFGSLFQIDGEPARPFYEYADLWGDVKGLGRYMVALHNTNVATLMGRYDDAPNRTPATGWKMTEFTPGSAENAAYGVVDMSVTNIGTQNGGNPGDVVIGYFDKLPGLEGAKTAEIFGAGVTNPKAIMVVNGLISPSEAHTNAYTTRTDNGTYWQTAQDVTLTLKAPTVNAKLMAVDPYTYEAHEVTPAITGNQAKVTLRLGGGKGALLYWTAPNELPAPPDQAEDLGTPFHPSEISAFSSQEAVGEAAPNGVVTALIDGTDDAPNVDSFWHTQWKDGKPGLPHYVVANIPENKDRVVGAVIHARKNQEWGGNAHPVEDTPKSISFFKRVGGEAGTPQATDKTWPGYEKIMDAKMKMPTATPGKEGYLNVFEFPQALDGADVSQIGVVFWDNYSGNPYVSLADLRFIQGEEPEPEPEPKPAVVMPEAPAFDAETGVITIPTVDGVVYMVAGKVVTEPVTVEPGQTVAVTAEATEGFELAAGAETSWDFTVEAPDPEPGPGQCDVMDRPEAASRATGALGDATGDRFADLWSVDESGAIHFYVNDGTGGFYHKGIVMCAQTQIVDIAVMGDVNGDDRSDVLVTYSDGGLYYYYSDGDGFLTKGVQAGHGWSGMDNIVYAGKLGASSTDYVVARQVASGDLYRYQVGVGGLFGGTKIGHGWSAMTTILAPGQFVGSGYADLVAIDNTGAMFAYAGGDGVVYSVGQIGHGWDHFVQASVPGDVDGDGRLDLIGIREDGALFAYKNMANGWWGLARQVGHGWSAMVAMS